MVDGHCVGLRAIALALRGPRLQQNTVYNFSVQEKVVANIGNPIFGDALFGIERGFQVAIIFQEEVRHFDNQEDAGRSGVVVRRSRRKRKAIVK
jgi:hypothetical protein